MLMAVYVMMPKELTDPLKQPCHGFGDLFIVQVVALADEKIDFL